LEIKAKLLQNLGIPEQAPLILNGDCVI